MPELVNLRIDGKKGTKKVRECTGEQWSKIGKSKRERGSYLQNSKIKYITHIDSPAFCEDDCSLVSIGRKHDGRENASFQVVEHCACIFQNEFPLEGNFYRERGNFTITSRGNEHFS